MEHSYRFLIIDDNGDSRSLLVRTLIRKLPAAVVQECQHADPAVTLARSGKFSAIITHRTFEFDGIALVALLRAANPAVPILMVSGRDRENDALGAGATRFMSYDEWLRLGNVMAALLAQTRSPFESERSVDGSPEPQPA
jgi:DNA-binding response OmpR family regulator